MLNYMNKKILTIAFAVLVFLTGLGLYFLSPKPKSEENTNISLYQEKDHYEVSDFKDAPIVELDELERVIGRLNEAYVYLREGNKPYLRWIDIGLYKKVLGDYKGAENAWRNSVSLAANPGLAYGNLANLYFYNLKEFDKAEEYYLKAIEITPSAYTYREGLSDLYRYELKDKRSLVEEIMVEGSKQDSVNAIVYYAYLFDFFTAIENKEKAGEYAVKIKQIDPNWEIYGESIEIND